MLTVLGQLRSLLFPDHGASSGFAAISPAGFELHWHAADQHPRDDRVAGIAELLDGADLVTTDADEQVGDLGGRRSGGYGFTAEDNRSEDWFPQGISGSDDGRVHAVSWYSSRREGVRISFVDLEAQPRRRYRHVRLVEGDRLAPIRIHAGGLAWVGERLFVVDTRRGLRVFDTGGLARAADGYVLPQIGAYRAAGAAEGLAFSCVFLDRADPALVIGEYRREPGGRIVRWPIDLHTGELAPAATAAHTAPIDRVQGVATARGHLLASCSRPGGRLFAGRPGQPAAGFGFWPSLPEDLHLDGDQLFSLSEKPGRRAVFAVPLAAVGL